MHLLGLKHNKLTYPFQDLDQTLHREEDMVCAHGLICVLACHLQWHMERDLVRTPGIPGSCRKEAVVADR